MNLKGRNFLTLKDFTEEEIIYLLDLAADLKNRKKKGIPVDVLRGKNVALILKKQVQEHVVLLKLQPMIWVWVQLIWNHQVLRLERKRALKIQRGFSEECMKVLNTEVSDRKSLKNWQNMPEFLYGMVLQMNTIRRRCLRISLQFVNTLVRSKAKNWCISVMPVITWRIPIWLHVQNSDLIL